MPTLLTARRLGVLLVAALAVIGVTQPAAGSPAHLPRADRTSATDLDKRITGSARRLEVVVEQFNQSREDLRATLAQRRGLNSRLTPLLAELSARQRQLDDLAAGTYRHTRSGPTVALFGAADPHRFVDQLLTLNQFGTARQRAVAEVADMRRQVDDARRTLDALAVQQRRQQLQITTRKAAVQGEIGVLKSMRMVAYGGGSRYPDDGTHPVPPYVGGPAGSVVEFAFGQLGKPYRWGAAGPRSYDCSGLTLAAWNRAGVHLPHNAASQYGSTAHLDRAQLQPGDLVFFYRPISHVGVYVGQGMMIHAPEYGENVRVARIDSQPIRGFGRPSA